MFEWMCMCAYVAFIFQLARADMEEKHGVIPTAKRTISATTPMISFVFAQACRGLRNIREVAMRIQQARLWK